MYLIVIAWIYVVLMMSVAEATNSTGTLLGALVTFVLYGLGPVALVVYLMGAPARSKAIKKREADERARHSAAASAETRTASVQPDAGGHATGGSETAAGARPVRKEP
jgi:Na+-transporting methylmalonyl-CoA/oxaloacetate decarboxylase gamma subunit